MKDCVKTSRGTLSIWSGSEGPRWDPYGYCEYEWEGLDGTKVVFHFSGLGEYIKVNGKMVEPEGSLIDGEVNLFKEITGFHPYEWERFINKSRSKCRKCGCKRTAWEKGYPGESFLVCANCQETVRSYFHPSEIE